MERKITVLSNKEIAPKIFKLTAAAKIPDETRCGNFVHIQLKEKPLRRPFCICDFSRELETLTIVYEVKGEGTKLLSGYQKGTCLDALFPLGNGFDIKSAKKIFLVGGGLGTAVLPAAFKSYEGEFTSFIGFKSKENIILAEELSLGGDLFVSTEDGSFGEKGFVTDCVKREISLRKPDIILACGPEPMLKSLQKISCQFGTKTLVSLEERMGCGVGACVVCAVKIKKGGQEHNLRVCKDGPVFDINEVVFN